MAAGDREPLAEAMRHAQIGTALIAPMLALGAIGYLLDRRWATGPWLMVAGLLLGMAGGFVNFVHLVTGRGKGGKDHGPSEGPGPKDGGASR